MYSYGEKPDIYFYRVEHIAYFIGVWLRKWGRVPVFQTKEKFGEVRVYCSLGWGTFHDIFYPGHAFIRWPRWVMRLDNFLCGTLHFGWLLEKISVPIHRWLFRFRYKQALKKWPEYREAILDGADWQELLRGL